LKILERVKGIEPSYSAWKAAALPLSYTRNGDDLTRRAKGLNRPPLSIAGIIAPTNSQCSGPARALNAGRFAVYIDVSTNNERR
jgi:hypothetical protein